MSAILQGTTPTLTITIPDEIPVANITALELAFKHGGTTNLLHLSDVVVDGEENTVSYTFSEEETLALNPAFPIIWQLRIQTADGIFGTTQARIGVYDLISEVELE